MARQEETVRLQDQQAKVADLGIKALMPVGRPLIDYVLSALSQTGYRKVCIVIRPDDDLLPRHCVSLGDTDLTISFAVQEAPLGTAHAVLAAEQFAADDAFLLINSDNYYPPDALQVMRQHSRSAVAGFTLAGLTSGNISPERARRFALILRQMDGTLARLIEKPSEAELANAGSRCLINCNCWRLSPRIFQACRAIPLSSRDEYELPDAVSYAVDELHESFDVLEVNAPVLDLSSRADVAEVTRRLAMVKVKI
jgi:glucose-1-phosphate thymidylyltransferase